MFESTPPKAYGEEESLRELSWSDLVARLNAARDLRRQFDSQPADELHPASFDVESASSISAASTDSSGGRKRNVNQDISGYRKGIGGRTGERTLMDKRH